MEVSAEVLPQGRVLHGLLQHEGSAERRARQGLCGRAHSGGPRRQGEAAGGAAGEELRQEGQNQVHAPAGPRHHRRQAEQEEDRRQGGQTHRGSVLQQEERGQKDYLAST